MTDDGPRQPNYAYHLGWLRSHEVQVLGFYHDEFERGGNPLWVWEALSYITEIRDCARKVGENFADLVVPSWCADYLMVVAGNLLRLADGVPPPERRLRATRQKPNAADDRLSPTQAQVLVPFALGLTRRGTSAFGRHRSTIEDELLFLRFEDLRRIGFSYEGAIAELQDMRPTTDASGLSKRVAAGKRHVERRRHFLPPHEPSITGER